jgi:uncharacterized protein YraI
MNDPVRRDAYGAPIENRQSDEFNTEDPQFDETWDEKASAFPLAYAWPEEEAPASDYVAEQGAADIEATLLSDLEAAATAFWTEFDPDDETAVRGTPWRDGDPASGTRTGQFEFHWDTTPEDLIGPEPHRTLMAFRPPRRRKQDTAKLPSADVPTVNFDVHATPDGAFADGLAARNKEFYALLRSNSAARKIDVPQGPARGPRFESVFPRAEPASRRHRATAEHAGSGLARQAAAAAILAVIVGIGLFVIAQQFAIPATSDDDIAALSDEASATTSIPLTLAPDPAETAAIPDGEIPKPVDDRPLTAAGVDPGTLTTPPLYESTEPVGQSERLPEPALAPDLATVPLRTETDTGARIATAPAEAAIPDETLAPPVDEAVPPESDLPTVAVEPATEAPARPERESVTIAPAPEAEAATTGTRRIAAGTGKVNSAVNMRAGPDNSEKVVRVLRAGTPVEILNSCKVWCEVSAGGDRGFIFQRFINRTGGSAEAEPTDLRPERAVQASLPAEAKVAPPEKAGGPLNLLRFGRPN